MRYLIAGNVALLASRNIKKIKGNVVRIEAVGISPIAENATVGAGSIVGEKEVSEGTVSVRREGVDQGSMTAEDFVQYIKSAVAEELKN